MRVALFFGKYFFFVPEVAYSGQVFYPDDSTIEVQNMGCS